MGTLTTIPFETDNVESSIGTQVLYKWLFVTTVPLCVIFGIIIASLMIKHRRQRSEIVTIDAAYTVPAHHNERHMYDLCDEGLHAENTTRENGHNQENTIEAPNSVPTYQNVRHIYDLCDKGLYPENSKRGKGQCQENV